MAPIRDGRLGKTLIVVSHRPIAIEHCDRVYRLDQGELVGDGRALEAPHTISASRRS